jgi:hypothetical protein
LRSVSCQRKAEVGGRTEEVVVEEEVGNSSNSNKTSLNRCHHQLPTTLGFNLRWFPLRALLEAFPLISSLLNGSSFLVVFLLNRFSLINSLVLGSLLAWHLYHGLSSKSSSRPLRNRRRITKLKNISKKRKR